MLRRSIWPAALLLATAAALPAQERDLDVLLDRLATYLEAYEAELSTLIADERYVQEEIYTAPGTQLYTPRPPSTQRVTEAEVLFLRLPGPAPWFGVRDVRKVDGKVVDRAGPSLAELMARPGDDLRKRAEAIVAASSRHNLGGRRTINMPTVPLEALGRNNQPRYEFKRGGRTRIHGTPIVRLEFQEFSEPTLVRGVDGETLWMRGTGWVDPETGALWRAEIVVGPDEPAAPRRTHLESRMRVDFIRRHR